MKSSKKKDTMKCTQDIRNIPPAAYRLATDSRKVKQLCSERQHLLEKMATYANGDGTSIKPSAQTLADALGWHRATVFRRINELKALGFLEDGELDEFTKTRIRSVNVTKVTRVFGPQPMPEGWTPVADSQNTCRRFESDLSQIDIPPVANRQPPVAISTLNATVPSLDRLFKPSVSTVITDRGISGNCAEICLSSSNSHDTTQTNDDPKPVGAELIILSKKPSIVIPPTHSLDYDCSGEALARRAARRAEREAQNEELSWSPFDSIEEALEFLATTESDSRWENCEHFLERLPNGTYRLKFKEMAPSYRNLRRVGYIPQSQLGKCITTNSPGVYLCRYGDCDNLAEDLSLYCAGHREGHGATTQASGGADGEQ